MKRFVPLLFVVVASFACPAQVAQPAQPMPSRTPGTQVAVPASMSPLGPEMSMMLSQLERTAQQTAMDVGKLSVNKWKADSAFKNEAQHDVNSVQANVTGTLPGLVSQVRANPDNTATLFKLYRNVDALLEVVRGLAESAWAFGPKSEFQDLQSDSQNLASVRGSLASQLDAVATAKESELMRMKTQLAQAHAAAASAAPPKKVIVDDNEPPKKTVKKKKPSAATTPPSSSQSQGSAPPKQ
jgi:hypothetical protein